MIEEGPFRDAPNLFTLFTVHLLLLPAVRPDIAMTDLAIGRTRGVVTELLSLYFSKSKVIGSFLCQTVSHTEKRSPSLTTPFMAIDLSCSA